MAGVKKLSVFTRCWIHLCLWVEARSTKGTDYDECVELAKNERDAAYKVWHDTINRVRGDRLWILYVQKRRYADGLRERKYGGFVLVNLDFSVPKRKIYQNLRRLGSDAAGVDVIPTSFIKLIFPVALPVLTHIFNHIFVSIEFPGKWKISGVFPSPTKFSDYRPISLLVCLSKVVEVLLGRQMEGHIYYNNLLIVFQSRFCRHHSTSAAVLKVTKHIRLSMENRQVTVLLLLDFS
jgi:hypothetical protein